MARNVSRNIIILLVTLNVITLGILCYKFTAKVIPQNPYPLLDFARAFIPKEHFLSTIQPLREELNTLVEKYSNEGEHIGIYFEYLNTGSNIGINEKERFWPASLSKMPTALAVMKKIEKKEWDLHNELVLLSEDKDERYGDLYKETVGTRFTIEELLYQTLVYSDNTAHRILVRNLATEDFTNIFEALGIPDLFDEKYDIAPKEYSRIFKALYSSSYLEPEYSEMILTWLSETPFNQYLASGVPENIRVSHKIGEEYEQNTFLDAGIVYVKDRPYLFVIMIKVSDEESSKRAQEISKALSSAAYAFISQKDH